MKSVFCFMCAILLFVVAPCHAAEVDFGWGQSTGQVDGYRILWGDTMGGPYGNMLCDVNATTLTHSATLDDNQIYYLAVRAYNQYGESGDSNELYWNFELPGSPGGFGMGISVPDVLSSIGADEAYIKFTAK